MALSEGRSKLLAVSMRWMIRDSIVGTTKAFVARAIVDMGAAGVQMGTRMVASKESPVHENMKLAVVAGLAALLAARTATAAPESSDVTAGQVAGGLGGGPLRDVPAAVHEGLPHGCPDHEVGRGGQAVQLGADDLRPQVR